MPDVSFGPTARERRQFPGAGREIHGPQRREQLIQVFRGEGKAVTVKRNRANPWATVGNQNRRNIDSGCLATPRTSSSLSFRRR